MAEKKSNDTCCRHTQGKTSTGCGDSEGKKQIMHSPGATPWVRCHRAHHNERMYAHVQSGCGRDRMSAGFFSGEGGADTNSGEGQSAPDPKAKWGEWPATSHTLFQRPRPLRRQYSPDGAPCNLWGRQARPAKLAAKKLAKSKAHSMVGLHRVLQLESFLFYPGWAKSFETTEARAQEC